MIKKRFLVMLLMMVFILSTCISAFAATSYDGDTLPQVRNNATGKNEDITAAVKENNGIGGKDVNDTYYTVNGAGGSYNTGFAPVTTIIGNTLECQFMLSDALSTMVISPRFYSNKEQTSTAESSDLYVDSTGIRYYRKLWSSPSPEITAKYDIVPGRWYTLVAEFDDYMASDGQQTGKFYINGDMVLESKNFKPYGFIRMGVGPVDAEHPIMIDNVICSNSRGADASETHVLNVERSKVSYITNIANGAVVSEELGDVMAIHGMTVADIKEGLTTTDGADDIVTIYNQDLTTVADNNDEAIGKVIVIASKNGTSAEQAYNYYDITELDLDKEHGRGKNASDLVLYNTDTTVTSVAGNYGKLTSDDVYKVVSTSKEQIHIPKTFTGDQIFGDYGVLEFQFALEPGAYVTLVLNGDADGYETGKEISINLYENTASIGAKGSSNESINKADIKNKEWYSAAITVPTVQNANDNLIKVYLNGEMVLKINETEMKSFRRPTLNIYNGYLDNISVSEGSAYNPLVDTPAYLEVANGVATSGKISYTQKPESANSYTLADASTSLRFYDKDWNETDAANAKYVLTATKDENMIERVIEYYEIDSEVSDYILAGYTNGSSYKVKAYSKDGATLYDATYDDNGSLASVTPMELNNEWKEINVNADSKVMLWKNDGTITPLKPVATFDLRK